MAKFVLLDHTVMRLGGHNYEYAYQMLHAVDRAGWEPVLACHKDFSERGRMPCSWHVFPTFPYCTYKMHRTVERLEAVDRREDAARKRRGSTGHATPSERVGQSWRGLMRWRLRRRANYYIEHFAQGARRLFDSIDWAADDQFFLPTVSPLDLAGLVKFLRTQPRATRFHWHLQFHFNLYEGREPSWPAQSNRTAAVQTIFRELAALIPSDRLHLYTTTDELARHYETLDVGRFVSLAYPVNPAFQTGCQAELGRLPLRVTYVGHTRREKGHKYLPELINRLWNDYFASGQAQLVVQAKRPSKLPKSLRELSVRDGGSVPPGVSPSAVAMAQWPMSSDDYLKYVLHAHLGLMLYDSNEYYLRCSGVLVEMLTAGIPVIVPAGCWMAEQISESIYAHQENLPREMRRVAESAIAWRVGASTSVHGAQGTDACQTQLHFGGADQTLQGELAVPPGATHCLANFRWVQPQTPGAYLKIEAIERDSRGEQVHRGRLVLGRRRDNQAVPILLPIDARTSRVELRFSNAYGNESVQIQVSDTTFYCSAPGVPLGAVGLIAAEADDAAELLRNMIEHYPHYRRTAAALAQTRGKQHDPSSVLECLLAETRGESRIAARAA